MTVASLVVPTYNERENLHALIDRVDRALARVTSDYEIIIVDDDSQDGTWRLALELAAQNTHIKMLRRQGVRGLATAVVAGWSMASGEFLGVIDADLQHPPELLPELLSPILAGEADVVIASRHTEGGRINEWSVPRKLISSVAGYLATVLLPDVVGSVKDPMSGYFVLRRSVFAAASFSPRGYKILLEILARGRYHTVVEIPYAFEARKNGRSKLTASEYVNFVRHVARLVWDRGEGRR